MMEHFKSAIADKKVLDIGCGNGNWTYKVAKWGAKSVDMMGLTYKKKW